MPMWHGSFYQDHEDDFVSDYAATNVSEDFRFAETFAAYVVRAGRGCRRLGDRAQFRFFDAVPEYADARDRIRAEFDLEGRNG